MSSTQLFVLVLKNSVENYQFKKSIFQGQQKKGMKSKNVRKTKSYVTEGKNFESVKGLHNVFSKIVSFLRISRY